MSIFNVTDEFSINIDKRFTHDGDEYIVLERNPDYRIGDGLADEFYRDIFAGIDLIENGSDVDEDKSDFVIPYNVVRVEKPTQYIMNADYGCEIDGVLDLGFLSEHANTHGRTTGTAVYTVNDDRIDVEVIKCEPVKNGISVFVWGRGCDGGFGDYANPVWSDPMTFNNGLMFLTDKDEAEKVVKTLNNEADDAFFSVGEHDSWDGRFPIEYDTIHIPGVTVSNSESSADEVIDIIRKLHGGLWFEQE